MLSRTTEKLSLDWPHELRESQASKLDERFLSGPNSRPERTKLPFFSDLHQEISRSWKQPFSSCLTSAAAADFTNLVGSVEQGYTAIPVVEDTLASHLSPSSRFKVQGSLLFVTYTIIQGIIGSEMLVRTGPLNGKCKKEK